MADTDYKQYTFTPPDPGSPIRISDISLVQTAVADISAKLVLKEAKLLIDPVANTITILSPSTFSNDVTVTGALRVDGNTTLGDASTDTLTIKAGDITFAGNKNGGAHQVGVDVRETDGTGEPLTLQGGAGKGTNAAGGVLNVLGGPGTGTGNPGPFIVYTYRKLTTGSTVQSETDWRFIVTSDGNTQVYGNFDVYDASQASKFTIDRATGNTTIQGDVTLRSNTTTNFRISDGTTQSVNVDATNKVVDLRNGASLKLYSGFGTGLTGQWDAATGNFTTYGNTTLGDNSTDTLLIYPATTYYDAGSDHAHAINGHATTGKHFSIYAGNYTGTTANTTGGNVYLNSGLGTGTSTSNVYIQTPTTNATTTAAQSGYTLRLAVNATQMTSYVPFVLTRTGAGELFRANNANGTGVVRIYGNTANTDAGLEVLNGYNFVTWADNASTNWTFLIDGATGDTTVKGNTTLGASSANTITLTGTVTSNTVFKSAGNAFLVQASDGTDIAKVYTSATDGGLEVMNGRDFVTWSGTAGSTGGDKFRVDGATGNTTIKGTLTVTGDVSLTSKLTQANIADTKYLICFGPYYWADVVANTTVTSGLFYPTSTTTWSLGGGNGMRFQMPVAGRVVGISGHLVVGSRTAGTATFGARINNSNNTNQPTAVLNATDVNSASTFVAAGSGISLNAGDFVNMYVTADSSWTSSSSNDFMGFVYLLLNAM